MEPIVLVVLMVLVVLVLLGGRASVSRLVANGIVGVVLLFVKNLFLAAGPCPGKRAAGAN